MIDKLSPREIEVLSLAVSGESNRSIAEKLVISRHTVKVHLDHIKDKLDVTSVRRVIAIGAIAGLGEVRK